jgi:ectoine hydroxylase-related dioxygenase (phytanoyl-CoA dioxygenase family)
VIEIAMHDSSQGTFTTDSIVEIVNRNGFAVVPQLLSSDVIDELLRSIESASAQTAVRERRNRVYAIRNLMDAVPLVRQIATSQAIRQCVEPIVGADAIAVRALLFDKTPEANWKVAWHQDLSIAVKVRMDVRGFGPWSTKAGVDHVQPPSRILAGMITVRLHLDDCDMNNGPLKVIPESHARGVLSPESVEAWCQSAEPITCCVPAGGALLMRPMILHASSAARRPAHRRVIHLEYASGELPGGLEWFERG